MLIDFHTHMFPDAIAAKAMPYLAEKGQIPYWGSATYADNLKQMDENGVDIAVVANIATSPHQEAKVNSFAIEINGPRFASFGSVHPHSENALSELERIAAAGLKGIKLHPEYQYFEVSDRAMYPVYQKCGELGLLILFHAGYDPGFRESFMASPPSLLQVAKDFPENRCVCAHRGGLWAWDGVETLLCGCPNLYFDTSFCFTMEAEQALRIIRKHGAERIVFGTDFPWNRVGETKGFLDKLPLRQEEKEQIYYKNAAMLLGRK